MSLRTPYRLFHLPQSPHLVFLSPLFGFPSNFSFVLSARIDLSGGWSDTPPITYEQGGTVLNVAVKLNGQVMASFYSLRIVFTHVI